MKFLNSGLSSSIHRYSGNVQSIIDPKERVPEWEEIAATAMAVQNIWLACAGSQIGGYWSTPDYVAELNDYLKLNQNERCLGLFYLGRFDELTPRQTDRNDIHDHIDWFE